MSKPESASQTDVELDQATAFGLARDQLVNELGCLEFGATGAHAKLDERLNEISTALDNDEEPQLETVLEARTHLRETEQSLDHVASLHQWNRWDAGVLWGDLTEAEREEIAARDDTLEFLETDGSAPSEPSGEATVQVDQTVVEEASYQVVPTPDDPEDAAELQLSSEGFGVTMTLGYEEAEQLGDELLEAGDGA